MRDGDALHILHVLPNRARDAFEYAYAPPSSAFATARPSATGTTAASPRDDDSIARALDDSCGERFGDVLRGTPYVLDITTGGRGNVAIGELHARWRWTTSDVDALTRVHVDARPRTGGEILRRERRELLFEKRDDAGGDGETGGTGEDAEIARRVRRRAVAERRFGTRFDSIRLIHSDCF